MSPTRRCLKYTRNENEPQDRQVNFNLNKLNCSRTVLSDISCCLSITTTLVVMFISTVFKLSSSSTVDSLEFAYSENVYDTHADF